MSTADTGASLQPAWVEDSATGFLDELERVGQTADDMGSKAASEIPYSTRMRPVSGYREILQERGDIFLESALFMAYDPTLTGAIQTMPDSGDTYQDATTIAEIITSQSTVTDAYMASRFRNGLTGNWQPNFCRPEIHFGKQRIWTNLGTTQLSENHAGDMSIGLPLPFSINFNRTYREIKDITVYGGLAQIIRTSAGRKIQRYGLMCLMQFHLP